MPIEISARFDFELDEPSDVLLQFEAAAIPEQEILDSNCRTSAADDLARVPAQDAIGERLWVRAHGKFEIHYTARVDVRRMHGDIASLGGMDPQALPGESVEYLFDSRYCPADRFQPFVASRFGETQGGARVHAICEWIAENFSYVPMSSDTNTTALDSFVERRGICRDYAHVLITLVRASAIPARYVSAYAPGVKPPDFHAPTRTAKG